MEYMLMHDGTVTTHAEVLTGGEVQEWLRNHPGSTYYWYSTLHGSWMEVVQGGERMGGERIQYEDVPDVIKLAAMLE